MSDIDNVIKTGDVAPVKEPKSFKDFNKEQLIAVAEAYGTLSKGTVKDILADLDDNGVTWELHSAKEVAPEVGLPVPSNIEEWEDDEGGEDVSEEVMTVEPVAILADSQKYLIKFVGENPYFEFEVHKFTQENPYGIMDSATAQRALTEEPTKFRQAFPAELQEFYS